MINSIYKVANELYFPSSFNPVSSRDKVNNIVEY